MEKEKFGKSSENLENFIERNLLTQKALVLATHAHENKKRDDGSPYINHCIEVARIAYEEWGIDDPEKLSALLLHDTVEDTEITLDLIKQEFGEKVAFWVDGLTKVEKAEKVTFKKIVGINLFDPNLGILKLADNLHNARTFETARADKRQRNAQKTLNYFAPLAESLGMWMVKTELEDLAFPYADPANFERYSKLFNEDERTRELFKKKMVETLKKIINDYGIDAEVSIRENSLVRLKDKKEPFEHINDVISYRIKVHGKDENEKRDNAYKLSGIMRMIFKDFEDQTRIDDFYSNPKFNGYSAIQMTLNLPEGATEIAITSDEKEDYNNWGLISLLKRGQENIQDYVLKIVITPTGQAKFLPLDANGQDLAYLINKKLAAQAVSITINGEVCDLTTIIPNGADVMINSGPDRIAPERRVIEKSRPQTKKKAEKQFIEQQVHEEEIIGKEIVAKIIAEAGLIDLSDLKKLDEHSDKLVNLLNYSGSKQSLEILYRLVRYGVIDEGDLRSYLKEFKITKEDLGLTSILIEGKNRTDLLGRFAREIARKKGDIRWEAGGSRDKSTFSIRLVVQGLSRKSEDKLRKKFQKNPNVSKLIIT